jgi:hypothetical protein
VRGSSNFQSTSSSPPCAPTVLAITVGSWRGALKLFQKSFGGLHICKNALVIPQTEHIIRCFLFERIPYKGLFYFWRVVLPL